MNNEARIERNRLIIEEFRAGKGTIQNGSSLILLSTIGAKSGEVRVIPLIAIPDGKNYLAVASKGGTPENPSWYYNLIAHPNITVEVENDTFPVTARQLTGDERKQAFAKAVAIFPPYEEYQQKTTREIPVFLLERHDPAQ